MVRDILGGDIFAHSGGQNWVENPDPDEVEKGGDQDEGACPFIGLL